MKTLQPLLALLLLMTATAAVAQAPDRMIEFTPVACILAEEKPVFQLNVAQPGDLRAYFRLVNTTEWCWVQGNNVGPISTVVMPAFRAGQEVEYFFVLLDGKRVIGKSPVVYRVRSSDHCDTLVARHSINFVVDCSHEVSGAANSFLTGYSLTPKSTDRPPHISPDTPTTGQ